VHSDAALTNGDDWAASGAPWPLRRERLTQASDGASARDARPPSSRRV